METRDIFQYSKNRSLIQINGKPILYEPNDTFEELVSNFVNAIQAGERPISGIEDGVQTVWIMEQAIEAKDNLGHRI